YRPPTFIVRKAIARQKGRHLFQKKLADLQTGFTLGARAGRQISAANAAPETISQIKLNTSDKPSETLRKLCSN
ncbi:MAG: hypothetical protein KJO30_14000, partial [Boseongicola sp.]|nr:hypothetical protein [Boseongicola sp.]